MSITARGNRRFGDEDSVSVIGRWAFGVGRWTFADVIFQRSTLNAQRPTLNSAEAMRRYSQRQSLTSLSEINITPLLDLAFVLLIIFMITTPLLENSMNLVIPSSGEKNPAINSAQVQTISIDRAETIKFNNKVVDPQALTAQLIDLKRANPEVAVVIRPDRDLPVQKLITLMDALQRAEITKVGIATKAEAK
jgi:biopolymer transport protein ExbD